MKKILILLTVGIFLGIAVIPVSVFAQADSIDQVRELKYWDQSRAFNGYTVLVQGRIIDMEGNLVWTFPNYATVGVYPDGTHVNQRTVSGKQQMVEWDLRGNEINVMPYQELNGRTDFRQHHEVRKIFNKILGEETVAMVVAQNHTYDEVIAHGADPDNNLTPGATNIAIDGIVELRKDGTILWEWNFFDHMVQDYDNTKLDYGDPADPANWGRLDVNHDTNSRPGLQADWNHCNSMDYNQTLDQFVINSREHGEIYIIDHGNTFVSTAQDFIDDPVAAEAANRAAAAGPAGDFLYRWGNPWNYGMGDGPTFNNNGQEQIFGAHCIHWIPQGLPGAGNFLIYDNSHFRPQRADASHVYEFNPYLDSNGINTGNYVRDFDAGYHIPTSAYDGTTNTSNQVVWRWRVKDYQGTDLFSWYISGAQRLPNGNTLVNVGAVAHVVEVTDDFDVVWDYRNPSGTQFRAYRYPPDYSGFAGLDFVAVGPISESTVGGALDKFRDSKTGFSGTVVILPGGGSIGPY